VADAGRDHLRAVGVRVVRGNPGEDADHGAAGLRRTAGGRFHHPAPTAADHRHPRPGQQSPDLLRETPRLGVLSASPGSDYRNLPDPSLAIARFFIQAIRN
jgi:hypothetical protein